MTPDIQFEKVGRPDDAYIQFLMEAYRGSFNADRYRSLEQSRDFFDWEYRQNPAPADNKPLVYVCKSDGEYVGQVSLLPDRLHMHDEEVLACWFQDFIILPSFRGRGLGTRLLDHAFGHLRSVFKVMCAFVTDERSYSAFASLGFEHVEYLSKYVLPTNPRAISSKLSDSFVLQSISSTFLHLFEHGRHLFYGFGKSARHDIQEIESFGEDFDRFWRNIANSLGASFVRDRDKLLWRFVYQPTFGYKIFVARRSGRVQGYIVLKESSLKSGRFQGLRVGIISDLLFDLDDSDTGAALLRAASQYFRDRVDLLRCDTLSPHAGHVLRKGGFIRAKPTARFLVHLLGRSARSEQKWHLTSADSDLDLY